MNAPDLRLRPADAALLVIDFQERLAPAMPEPVLARARRYTLALIEGAKLLKLPIFLTEQYPRGLGQTVPEVRAALPEAVAPISKVSFSCLGAPEVLEALRQAGRRQVIACGMESHVCVYQTVRDLQAAGYQAFVPQDAVASRTEDNLRVGLALMERAGAVVTCAETVLFDLLGCAGTAEFKAISALIK